MVFQNVYLFNDTIRANLCFGKPDATEDEMIAAAKKARCHDFIMALPNGYDTVVGEGGGTLSGGEKQRISIARAMLKDAPIIILDEATASIDPENEHLIQSALSELTRGKTIITIAHRLATIQNADQILVVEDGRIAERGTHDELMRQNGVYRRFIEIRETGRGLAHRGSVIPKVHSKNGGDPDGPSPFQIAIVPNGTCGKRRLIFTWENAAAFRVSPKAPDFDCLICAGRKWRPFCR